MGSPIEYRKKLTNKIMNDDTISLLSLDEMYELFNILKSQYDNANLLTKIRNNYPQLFKSIFTYYNKIYKNNNEIFYLLTQKTLTQPKCKYCNNLANFKKDNKGYANGCSIVCNFKYSREIKEQNKNSIIGNLSLTDKQLKTELSSILKNKQSKGFSDSIYSRNKELIPLIHSRTKYLKSDCKLNERIFHILNDLYEIPKCKICNKIHLKFNTFVLGYRKNCVKCNRVIQGKKGSITIGRTLRSKNYDIKVKLITPDFKILNTKENYIETGILRMKHVKCGYIHERTFAYENGCPKCHKAKHSSEAEKEIRDFIIANTNLKVISRYKIYPYENRRKYREIDIYIPELKLGIEYNGLYWHSERAGKDKNFHLEKTIKCNDAGIHLIHIFEHEWLYKSEIIKSILLSKFNKYNVKIYARKCEIKQLDCEIKDAFLNKNHLQGKTKSKINLGLYHNDILVSIMTFGKRKITGSTKQTKWEIIRYASKLNHQIVGGASKLFKHFKTNFVSEEPIISYADRRFSNGELYTVLGFKFSHASAPGYLYFKNCVVYNRINFQKHKLKNKLKKFNSSLTEWQNMLNNGYNRIWDCGNLVYYYNH